MQQVTEFDFRSIHAPELPYKMECVPFEVLFADSATLLIRCPFCTREFTAFRSTLANTGKNCPRCKAKHLLNGRAHERAGS